MAKLNQTALAKRLAEAGVEERLRAMQMDETLDTTPSYSANSERYPDNQIPFVDKHLAYLMAHPAVDFGHYLANLRLMIKKRPH